MSLNEEPGIHTANPNLFGLRRSCCWYCAMYSSKSLFISSFGASFSYEQLYVFRVNDNYFSACGI